MGQRVNQGAAQCCQAFQFSFWLGRENLWDFPPHLFRVQFVCVVFNKINNFAGNFACMASFVCSPDFVVSTKRRKETLTAEVKFGNLRCVQKWRFGTFFSFKWLRVGLFFPLLRSGFFLATPSDDCTHCSVTQNFHNHKQNWVPASAARQQTV